VAFIGLDNIQSYENFLLVISYWIGPWLGVYLTDWFLRRGHRVDGFLFDRRHRPYAGWVAMLVGMVLSVWLFADQRCTSAWCRAPSRSSATSPSSSGSSSPEPSTPRSSPSSGAGRPRTPSSSPPVSRTPSAAEPFASGSGPRPRPC
jgi:hypothetical protein